MILEYIGEKIKNTRKSRKISQEKLAEMISMNHRSIVRIENGHTLPTLETLEKLSDALDVDVTYFLEQQTFKNKTEIIKDITNLANKMSLDDLKKLQKIIHILLE